MRGYGLPRYDGVDFPDKADIKEFGHSTTDRCSRADRGKNKARRRFAKKARSAAKADIFRELKSLRGNEES